MSEPYIGITGFTSPIQIKEIKEFWKGLDIKGYKLMMGFLLSYKDLYDPGNMSNLRYTSLSDEYLQNLLQHAKDESILRIVHYNTHEKEFSKEIDFIMKEGVDLDGFQFNISKPAPSEIRKIYEKYDFKIILQINNSLIHDFRVGNYPTMDYYLIDPSGGRGKEIGIDFAKLKVEKLIEQGIEPSKIVIAGGLSPKNIYYYRKAFPNQSFDAESNVRMHNRMDITKVKKYLLEFVKGGENE